MLDVCVCARAHYEFHIMSFMQYLKEKDTKADRDPYAGQI